MRTGDRAGESKEKAGNRAGEHTKKSGTGAERDEKKPGSRAGEHAKKAGSRAKEHAKRPGNRVEEHAKRPGNRVEEYTKRAGNNESDCLKKPIPDRRKESSPGIPHVREHWRAGNMLYPVPAVMVSCQRPGERPNIITVAWAGTVCSSPAMVSISVRPTRYSYEILKETGEFVINLTTEQLTFAADYCGVKSGRDVDKFAQMHLTPGEAVHVGAPIIEESPVNIECRTVQVLELGSHHLFVAEVLGVDVDSAYLDEHGKLLLNEAGQMVYSHGEYFGLGKSLGKFGYSVRKRH